MIAPRSEEMATRCGGGVEALMLRLQVRWGDALQRGPTGKAPLILRQAGN